MPLWKIYHPAGTYNAEDKKLLAEKITGLYASIPLPKFYVVVIFEEIAPRFLLCRRRAEQQFYPVQGRPYCEDLAWPAIREWWVRKIDEIIASHVKDRGYDWEVSIDETPFDLWSLQGEIPPPFESMAEKRWVEENRASSYTLAEKLPVRLTLTPGLADR